LVALPIPPAGEIGAAVDNMLADATSPILAWDSDESTSRERDDDPRASYPLKGKLSRIFLFVPNSEINYLIGIVRGEIARG
jgi:hypothetical protein